MQSIVKHQSTVIVVTIAKREGILMKNEKQTNEFDLITMGEIMLRLSPPRHARISDGDIFEKKAGGAELNVASGVAQLGLRSAIISSVPKSELGNFIKNRIRFNSVSDDFLLFDHSKKARLGIYYYEMGAYPRKPLVFYDRSETSVNTLKLEELPEEIWSSSKMFHTSGITLALSQNMQDMVIEAIKKFKENGTMISFDVNYRASLWSEEQARTTICKILPMVDVLFVSEETSRRMFQKKGDLQDVLKSYSQEYGIQIVASTQRTVHSPEKHDFTSILYHAATDTFYQEEPYRNIDVIDRIGSGDAYVAGVLFGILKFQNPAKALWYGNAMSSVKNTIPGDLPSSSYEEISGIIQSHQGNGGKEELNR